MPNLDPLDLYDIQSLLSEEEIMVRDTVARFVNARVLPIIRECFEEHRFPAELIPELASLGLLGSSIEGYGCAGLNSVAYGLICQELERGDSGLRSFVSVQSSLVMYPIFSFGTEEQKQRWLPAMAAGEAIGCGQIPKAIYQPLASVALKVGREKVRRLRVTVFVISVGDCLAGRVAAVEGFGFAGDGHEFLERVFGVRSGRKQDRYPIGLGVLRQLLDLPDQVLYGVFEGALDGLSFGDDFDDFG